MMPNTLLDMKYKLFDVAYWRDEVAGSSTLGWVTNFRVDAPANLKLRKTDVINFAAFNEGNLYNNLFLKVF